MLQEPNNSRTLQVNMNYCRNFRLFHLKTKVGVFELHINFFMYGTYLTSDKWVSRNFFIVLFLLENYTLFDTIPIVCVLGKIRLLRYLIKSDLNDYVIQFSARMCIVYCKINTYEWPWVILSEYTVSSTYDYSPPFR